MEVITTVSQMEHFSTLRTTLDKTIGFVPTMGALHQGHLSLIQRAKAENDVVVVSVFVNPTQFNDNTDLLNYPRTYAADKELLEQENVDVMFFPSVEEIYPEAELPSYEMDGLDLRMEGPNRPGHFNGVVQVVMRFFDVIHPVNAYFGEKDFQQLAIIRHMSAKLGYKTNVIGCATLREPDGLAMSSRNTRLSAEGKISANGIHRSLLKLKEALAKGENAEVALQKAHEYLNTVPAIRMEYFELINADSLRPLNGADTTIQACVAAWIDGVRLIDNMRVK